jgi:uncharacterized repeat protein (TIGR01451 family)
VGRTRLLVVAAACAGLAAGGAGPAAAQSAALSVFKQAAPSPAVAGVDLTYAVFVNNEGPDDALNVALADALPPQTGFLSLAAPPGWACTSPAMGQAGTITCATSAVPVGSELLLVVVAVSPGIPPGSVLTNTVTATTTTAVPDPGQLSFTLDLPVTAEANLGLVESAAPSPAVAGRDLAYTLTVTQAGPSDASAVAVADTIPAGTTFQSLAAPPGWTCLTPPVGGTGAVLCSTPTLPVGSTAVLTLVVRVDPALPEGATIASTASVSSGTPDPIAPNDVSATLTPVVAEADLSIAKSAVPGTVVQTGSPVDLTYTLAVASGGPSDALSVSVADAVPAGTTFRSLAAPAGWSCLTPPVGGTGAVTCTTPVLAPGSAAVFTLVARVDVALPGGATVTNMATIASATPDPAPANDTSTTAAPVVVEADVSIAKSAAPAVVLARSSAALVYTLVVTNRGPSPAAPVTVTDPVPAGTGFQSVVPPPIGWICTEPPFGGTGVVSCTIASMAPGGSAVIALFVRPSAALPGGSTIDNTATVATGVTDPDPANNTAGVTTPVVARPIAVGPDAGGGPHVRLLDPLTGAEVLGLFAFDPAFLGGVRVALGDVDGDGRPDAVAGAGPGGQSHVRVFDGVTGAERASVAAYPPGFLGGVYVAAGDVDGDGVADLVTGAGATGDAHVRVLDGATGADRLSFYAYAPGFLGGVRVAATDASVFGGADLVTGAGPGGAPHVQVFDGATGALIRSFLAYDPGFLGGVFVAAGDVNGDAIADVITGADAGGAPHVRVFDGRTGAELLSFFAYDPAFTGGVRVGVADLDGDGLADILTAPGPGGGPHVRAFSGVTGAEQASVLVYPPGFTGGVFIGGF